MKQLRGSFLTPGGSLPRLGTPTFITFRPFRRFSTLKNNSKVFGSNDSLRPATQTIENSKAQLVHLSNANSPNPECLPLQCKVPLKRVKKFPMINVGKTVGYNVPNEGAITISHDTNMMLKKTLTGVPAVTKILGATLSERSQKALDRWKQGLLASLGEEGFKVFYENQLRQGSDFHNLVGKFLLRGTDTVEKHDDPCLKSLKHVFSNISDVGVIESQVVHPQLAYRGVVDCVAKYKGKPVVIEWKRSDRAKPSIQHTYDAPLQLSAYIGAMNYDSNYGLQVNGGVVIVAHSDGSPADVFELSLEECEHYWLQWLKRLHQYFIQEPSKGIV